MQGLELDGYNASYKIAFEYQGDQHYNSKDFRHVDEESFQALQERDARKKEILKTLGIYLIEIDGRDYSISKPQELRDYVTREVVIACDSV